MNANKLNNHLASGGVVLVSTYCKSWQYEAKHAGWFTESNGELYVKRGKSRDYLGRVDGMLLVGIKLGRYT